MESKELSRIPKNSQRLNGSSNAMDQVRHLTSGLFKGAYSIPDKTVELVFRPEIQEGLKDGTYTLMKTKSGEVLADAIDSNKTIAGKARVVSGGKVRQIASGAFHLVSIAVAQSHLADIQRSLGNIQNSLQELLRNQENKDRTEISGAVDYLSEIADHMKTHQHPEEVSAYKCNMIEGIIFKSFVWRNKLEEDLLSLTQEISNLKDQDTFGTGSTYEALYSLTSKVEPLIKRYELLLDLASATTLVTAYLDPNRTKFSKMQIYPSYYSLPIDKFKLCVHEKSKSLLSSALFNGSETLELRKERIKSLANEHYNHVNVQKDKYIQLINKLDSDVSRLIGSEGEFRVAVSFDSKGEVYEAALIEK